MADGAKNEKECYDILESVGYEAYKPATVRFGENDPWGLFDVLAYHPEKPPIFAQVKSNGANGISAWVTETELWRENGIKCQYWVRHDSEGWVIYDAGQEPEDARRAARVVLDERALDDVGPNVDTPKNTGEGAREWLKSLQNTEGGQ